MVVVTDAIVVFVVVRVRIVVVGSIRVPVLAGFPGDCHADVSPVVLATERLVLAGVCGNIQR